MSGILFALVPLFAAAAIAMLALGLWPEKFLAEAQRVEDAKSRAAAAGSVFVRKVGLLNLGRCSDKYSTRFRRRYVMAGLTGTLSPEEFLGLQEVSCVGFSLAGLIILFGIGWPWWVLPAFGFFGWMYPEIWLNDKIKKRHHKITRALPYNLDLMTLAVEAGLDFTGALQKVVEKGQRGPLVDELSVTLNELMMGKTREEALRGLSTRVNLPTLSSFVSTLLQADRMGTPLGRVLRIQSTQMRIDRTQRAEKLAGEAPVKMLGPLILCIFPTVFMVLFGPIVFQFVFGRR